MMLSPRDHEALTMMGSRLELTRSYHQLERMLTIRLVVRGARTPLWRCELTPAEPGSYRASTTTRNALRICGGNEQSKARLARDVVLVALEAATPMVHA